MGPEALDTETLLLVLGFLSPRDISAVSQSNRYLRQFIKEHETIVWQSTLKYCFGVELESSGSEPHQWCGAFPDIGNSLIPERDLCLKLHALCSRYGSIGYRMIRIWDGLYSWAQQHALPLKETLLPGVSLDRLEKCHQLVIQRSNGRYGMPMELAALYALCGGQSFARLKTPSGDPFEPNAMNDDEFPEGLQLEFSDAPGCVQLQGLFGGMKVYHDEFSLSLIPFETMVYCSIFKRLSRPGFLVALNLYGVRYKHMYLEPTTGQLQFDPKPGMSQGIDCVSHSRRLFAPGRDLPSWYVPPEDEMKLIAPHFPETEGFVREMGYEVQPIVPMVHWLESYMMEVSRGNFRYKYVPDLGERIIWKFPALAPECSEVITHGISVKSSCVLVPHAIQNPSVGLVWAYSIEFRLLSVDEQKETCDSTSTGEFGGPLRCVQLQRRHWKITSANGIEEVDGEGVIGEYPVLKEGGESFDYSSYTSIVTQDHYTHKDVAVDGIMEGYFMFVEIPEGNSSYSSRRISAVCPTMHLTFPNIIY